MKQVHLGELREARMATEASLIGRRHESVAHREAFRLSPQRRRLDRIDAIAPRIALLEAWLVQPVCQLQAIQLATRQAAERAGFDAIATLLP